MRQRKAVLLDAAPDHSLLEAIPKLVDPLTNRYAFPTNKFFDGISKVHADGFTGDGQTVAIVDTGIDATHPLLRDAVVGERDFTGEGTTEDPHGHGTLVALIIRYVAPNAKLLNARAFSRDGQAGENGLSSALKWLQTQSPSVINLSGGIPARDPASTIPKFLRRCLSNKSRGDWLIRLLRRHWFYRCDVCNTALGLWKAGCAVCVAVGNDRETIICPGRGTKDLMLIGEARLTGDQPAVAAYSAYWPDFVAPEIPVAEGTSFSAPFVTGTVALLLEVISRSRTAPSATALALIEQGDAFFSEKRFTEAIDAYKKGLAAITHLRQHDVTPVDAKGCLYCQAFVYTPRMKLALSYLQSDDPVAPMHQFEQNVTIAPAFADGHMNLGAAQRMAGCFDESIRSYQHALALDPARAEAYDGLGDTHLLKGCVDEAIGAFERSRNLNSGRLYPVQRLLQIYGKLGNVEAIARWRGVLSTMTG